jgi:ligand-binding sensor domain-containing protein
MHTFIFKKTTMKKTLTLFLMLSVFVQAKAEFQSVAQWKLFTGDYAFLENNVDKSINFLGAYEVAAFTENNVGNVIFAVNGKGIFIYDGKTMQNPKMPKECYASLAPITSLACDSKNTIWIGTTLGLVSFQNNSFTNIGSDITKIQVITDISITATDKLYVSGLIAGEKEFIGAGVSFFNGTTWTNFNSSNSDIPDNLISNLLIDQLGFLWAIPGQNDKGVVKFDGKVWKTINKETGLPNNEINTIAIDTKGKIYLGSPKGIIMQEDGGWAMKAFSNSFSPKISEFLSRSREGNSLDVNTIAIEDNGTIWVGTKDLGLFSFSQGGIKLLHRGNSPLFSNAIRKISIDKNGFKWILPGYKNPNYAKYGLNDLRQGRQVAYSFENNGVIAYREHGKITDPKWTVYDSTSSPIKIGTILSIEEDKERNIWFTNTAEGLIKYHDKKFEKFTTDNIFHNAFTSLFISPDNKIYLSGTMGGVKVFENGTISDFAKNPNMGGVNNIAYDKNNSVWVSGMGGISHYINNDWETFKKKDGLPSIVFYCIFKDNKNMLWAGSANGLVKYDSVWQVVGKDIDFPSNDIKTIAEDGNGKFWIGSNKGLIIYDGTNFNLMPKIESLDINKFIVNKISIDKSNEVWVATKSYGALHFDGTNWVQYDKKNSQGALLDEITAIKAGSDNKVYIASKALEFGVSSYELPTQDPFEIIKRQIVQKIKLCEPKNLITIIQVK